MGFENIHCTLNHKFYVREKYRKGHKSIRCFKKPIFKELKNISKNDYFGVPVIQEEEFFYRNDLDFWYMIGYYLGDGWLASKTNDVFLACNEAKLKKLKSRLDINKWKYTYHWNSSCYRFRFANKEIYDFIKKYIGTGSFEKRICGEMLRLPKKQLKALLDGYLDSDGCKIKKNIQFSSVNRQLIYSISSIINKVYHRPTSISKNVVSPTKMIDGRMINQHDWYLLRFKPMNDKQDKAFYEDGYIWYPFNKLLDGQEECVYNMEIENDHSYIIQGCVSKNCQDFSLAGKQAGGDKDSGTRSSLMYETIRIVEKLKPKYVVWENVKNLLSKKHRHNFDAYLETMENLGYTNHYQVMNAKDYGIPQNRERVFTVSIRNEYVLRGTFWHGIDDNDYEPYFNFPPKQELKLKLKDILEDNVDEKYYLSDEQVERIRCSIFHQNNRRIQEKQYCDTLCARDWKDPKCVVADYRYDEGLRIRKNGLSPCLTTKIGSPSLSGNTLLIKNATKQGYLEATDGDGCYISNIDKKRGTVQKEMIPTLKTSPDIGCVVDKPRKDIKELDKYCKYCGNKLERKRFNGRLEDFKVFSNRQYCNRECMKKDYLKIGKHNQSYSNAHATARKINELILHKDVCEICGSKTNLDIHHIDGDWQNNSLDNLMCLCRSCHTKYEKNKNNNLRIRKLTPRETWRLMGFDDEDFEKAEKVNSNTQLYKQAGNSIVVNVLEAIFKNLLKDYLWSDLD